MFAATGQIPGRQGLLGQGSNDPFASVHQSGRSGRLIHPANQKVTW